MNEEKLKDIIDNNIKKEYAVISCLLNKPELLLEHAIDSEMFQNNMSKQMFDIIEIFKRKYEQDEIPELKIDIIKAQDIANLNSLSVTSNDLLECKNTLQDDGLISIDNFASYIEDLRDVKTRVKLFNMANNLFDAVGNPRKNANGILFEFTNKVTGLEDSISFGEEPQHLSTSCNILDECINGNVKKVAGIETGFPIIDQAIDGLQNRSLTVVGARAKVGKSAFGLNTVLNVALKYGEECPILYIDTEMASEQQKIRALSILSKIPAQKIRRHDLTPYELDKLKETELLLSKLPIYHLYTPNFTVDGIVSLCRKMHNKKGIGLVVYDYIKLPDNSEAISKHMQEYQVLGMLTNALKNKIAGKLNIPVLTFGQLNREGVKQSTSGEVDETSIGASDRIIHYCSTYMVLRKPPEEEQRYQPQPNDPEWKKMGKFGNRMMHIIATRDGGDSADPVPIYYEDSIITMREGRSVKDAIKKTTSDSISAEESQNTV